MIKFTRDPLFDENMRADLEVAIFAAAEAAAEGLEYRLSASAQERTGRKYKKYPRRSSRFGEYPQEQFGELRAGVGVQVGDSPIEYDVGIFGVDPEKLMYIEYTGAGARRPLYMYFEGLNSAETVSEMNQAIGSR